MLQSETEKIDKLLHKPSKNKFIVRRRPWLIISNTVYQFFQYERRTTYFTEKFSKLKTQNST